MGDTKVSSDDMYARVGNVTNKILIDMIVIASTSVYYCNVNCNVMRNCLILMNMYK